MRKDPEPPPEGACREVSDIIICSSRYFEAGNAIQGHPELRRKGGKRRKGVEKIFVVIRMDRENKTKTWSENM